MVRAIDDAEFNLQDFLYIPNSRGRQQRRRSQAVDVTLYVWEGDRSCSDLHVNAGGEDACNGEMPCGGRFASKGGSDIVTPKAPPSEGQSRLVRVTSTTHGTRKNDN